MEKLQPKGDSVNNAVPFVEAHVSVTTFSSQALTEQDRISRLLSAFLTGRNERTIRAYGADLDNFSHYLVTPRHRRGFTDPALLIARRRQRDGSRLQVAPG